MEEIKLPQPPQPFDRATGAVEGRRKCRDCHATYPVTDHSAQRKCPKCDSANTSPLPVG